jgi:hypothetical protein
MTLDKNALDRYITGNYGEDQFNPAHDKLCETLEELIDKSCLYEVIQCLIEICYLKEDHTRETWGTEQWRLWKHAGQQLEKLKIKV